MLSWYQRVQSVPRTPIHHHLNCWYKADGAMFSCFYTNFWPELHSRYQDLSDRTMFFCFFLFLQFSVVSGTRQFPILNWKEYHTGWCGLLLLEPICFGVHIQKWSSPHHCCNKWSSKSRTCISHPLRLYLRNVLWLQVHHRLLLRRLYFVVVLLAFCCNKWLYELLSPSYQLEKSWPFPNYWHHPENCRSLDIMSFSDHFLFL